MRRPDGVAASAYRRTQQAVSLRFVHFVFQRIKLLLDLLTDDVAV